MRLRHPLEYHEQSDRFGYAPCNSQEAVISQHDAAVRTERAGDALPAIGTQNLYFLIVKNGMVIEKQAGLLRNWLHRANLGGERCAPGRVHMCGADDVGPGVMDGLVDTVPGLTDRAPAVDDAAVRSDKGQIVRGRPVKRHVAPQHPEAVCMLRIPRADVPVAQVAPALSCKKSVGECEFSLAMRPLVLMHVCVLRRRRSHVHRFQLLFARKRQVYSLSGQRGRERLQVSPVMFCSPHSVFVNRLSHLRGAGRFDDARGSVKFQAILVKRQFTVVQQRTDLFSCFCYQLFVSDPVNLPRCKLLPVVHHVAVKPEVSAKVFEVAGITVVVGKIVLID